ncbi:hypothetical protein [Ruegeria sp. HKCCA4812]|uniref:hypothetical protein n=1 Tax=Ruegeria sp. HKCCA4812 TaxID=2682993 RepID=UPI001488499D|nr:hypothetical protein [Ruegeria sp. HKCCA4812]
MSEELGLKRAGAFEASTYDQLKPIQGIQGQPQDHSSGRDNVPSVSCAFYNVEDLMNERRINEHAQSLSPGRANLVRQKGQLYWLSRDCFQFVVQHRHLYPFRIISIRRSGFMLQFSRVALRDSEHRLV